MSNEPDDRMSTPYRSPTLGTAGLLGVVILAIVTSVLAVRWAVEVGPFIGPYIKVLGSAMQNFPLPPLIQAAVTEAAVPTYWAGAAGLIAWIVCIVAYITNRGRGRASVGIIIGFVAPFVAYVLYGVALAPYVG